MSIFNSNRTTKEAGITPTLLDAITDAYNRNNIDEVMSFFADDAVFDHAAGPDTVSYTHLTLPTILLV